MPRRSVTLVEFSPSGGLFHFAVQLGEALASGGHDVQVVTGPRPELRPTHPGLCIRSVLPTWHPAAGRPEPVLLRKSRRLLRAARYLTAWLVLERYLARSRPDAVLFGEWRFPLDAWFVRRLARRAQPPVLLDVAHAPLPFNEQRQTGEVFRTSPRLTRALRQAYGCMDAVLVLGERSRRDLLGAWPEVRRVEVIPHGNEAIFVRAPVPPPDHCPPRILFFGTLTTYKGLDVLLDAFALLRRRLPDAALLMAGAPSADVDAAALRRRAALIGNVDVRPAYVPMEAVGALFGAARVVAAPYLFANASGVVHLAQTFGRPVVASSVGDLPEAVRDGETGLLVPPGDATALAGALERLLRDPALAARLGAAGAARLAAEGSWAEVAARVEAVIEDCVAGRTDPRRDLEPHVEPQR